MGQHGLEDVAAAAVWWFANLHNLPCNPFPLLPNGPPPSPPNNKHPEEFLVLGDTQY